MDENKNLVTLTDEILTKLTDAFDVLNSLYEIVDGDRTTSPLIKFVKTNVGIALDKAEECRTLISD